MSSRRRDRISILSATMETDILLLCDRSGISCASCCRSPPRCPRGRSRACCFLQGPDRLRLGRRGGPCRGPVMRCSAYSGVRYPRIECIRTAPVALPARTPTSSVQSPKCDHSLRPRQMTKCPRPPMTQSGVPRMAIHQIGAQPNHGHQNSHGDSKCFTPPIAPECRTQL